MAATIRTQVDNTWVGRRLRRAGGTDDGFFLLESVVAITILTIIMAALTAFFTETVHTTSLQRAKQTAVQVADAALDSLRAIPADDLKTGHDQTSVSAQFGTAPDALKTTWLDAGLMKPSVDTTPGATAVVPTSPTTTTLNGTTFNVSRYIGDCASPIGNSAACTSANLTPAANDPTAYVAYVRAVVAVDWTDTRCGSSTCRYVTATLITKTITDPTFNLNQSPSPAPVAVSPGDQTSVVGDDVSSVAFTMKDGTGVPTATWTSSSTLPAGIILNPDGTFSGSPTAATSALTITATLHDGFLRTATASFKWTVLAAVSATPPSAQTSTAGTAISPLTLTATGGTGAPYTWSDPTGSLPPGLALTTVSNQGKIAGTPTKAGTYAVSLTITDAGGHKGTVAWTWTVGNPPIVATNPGPQSSTRGAPANLLLSYTGGSGTINWTSTALPAGLTLSPAGLISGTPTTLGTTSVTVTAMDSANGKTSSQTFLWTVVGSPTVAAPATQTSTVTGAVSVQVATTCPNAPCTYALVNGPSGLGVSGTGVITGTVGGSPTTYSAVKVTVTDAAGVSATTSPFTWVVVAAPSVTAPAAQTSTVTGAVNLQLVTTCGNGPCTYAVANGPSGLSVSSTGLVTGPMGSPTGVFASTRVTVVDAGGVTATSSPFTWTVLAAPTVTTPGAQTSTVTSTVSLQLSTTCANAPCSYTLVNGPSGLTVSATGRVTGTLGASTGSFPSAKVTVVDAGGVAASTATFSWSVVAAPTITTPPAQASQVGGQVSLQLTTACPNSPCTYSLLNGPPGLSVSSSGLVTGTVGGSATVYSTARISVTDASGITTNSNTFSWTVTAPPAPTISTPSTQTTYVNTPARLDMSALTSNGTNPLTYSATNLPSWLTINASTGVITGTAPSTKSVTTSISVTVTDASNRTATTATFKWIVTDLRLVVPDQWTSPGAVVTPMDIDTYLSGGTTPYVSPYSVTVSGLPTGITYNTTSHTFGGTAPTTRVAAPMTVVVTDAQGASVTDTFTWYVSSLRLTFGDQVTAPNTAVNLDLDNYVTGGTASSIGVSGQPAWVAYNSTTHVLSGTAPASASPVTPVVITVQESSGFTFTKSITWYVSDLRWSGLPTSWATSWWSTVSADVKPYDFGGTGPFTYTATGLPANVRIDPATGVITNSGTTSMGTYTVTVTVTDSTGAFATSPVVTWSVGF